MLSSELTSCVSQAMQQARAAHHEFLTVEHLLLAILGNPTVREAVADCGADPQLLVNDLRQYLAVNVLRREPDDGHLAQPQLGFQRVLQRAVYHRHLRGSGEVRSIDVLAEVFSEKRSYAASLLTRAHVTRQDVVNRP